MRGYAYANSLYLTRRDCMAGKEHQDYEKEQERLDYTVGYLDKIIDSSDKRKALYKENIRQSMGELEQQDSSSIYIDVLTNTKFLESAEKNYASYKKARPRPYFARIDFKGTDEDKVNAIYIGKVSLIKEETNDVIIVDWRAPIASLYYEGRLGRTSYESEGDVYVGEMSLKRQLMIANMEIENILDIDITATDSFLQASLEANAESRLSDIATSIQAEQNRVIRAAMNKPLIVQGVAGSGKTTIALHRIAYFVYTYEKTFDPERFLILAPNNLFINYISAVLPELGVEKVKQSTFIDFVGDLIGKEYTLTDPDAKLITLIQASDAKEGTTEFMKWASAFKGSLEFRDITDGYIAEIERNLVPLEDFTISGHVLIKNSQIRKMFLNDFNYLPLFRRIKAIKKTLNNKLQLVKNAMLNRVVDSYDRRMALAKSSDYTLEQSQEKIRSLIRDRDEKLKKLNQEMKLSVNKYVSKFQKRTLHEYYQELVSHPDNLFRFSKASLPMEEISYLCTESSALLESKQMEIEDYAALAYLKHKIFGFEKKIEINSLVIDEAQDYSLFQFYALRTILNTEKFTLLGDLSQGIYAYRAINSWQEVIDKVFGADNSNYKTLRQSYRTTVEVMLLANEVIKKLENEGIVLAEPVIRHGEKPEKKSFQDEKELVDLLERRILEMKQQEYKSIAIICKTVEECRRIKRQLDKEGRVSAKVLDDKQQEYEAGTILVPSNLAKGLEFDVVFVINVEERYCESELDIKLLYVAMTRTLHRLFVFHMDGTMPLLDSVQEEFYMKN